MSKQYLQHSYYATIRQNKYTFSKSPRFPPIKQSDCKNPFYQIPARTSRKAGIGYGTKFSFEKLVKKTPSPNHYNIELKPTKGISFGSSRELVKFNSYIDEQTLKNPSPGKYQTLKLSQGSSYSLTQKRKRDSFLPISRTPGPGTYQMLEDLDRFGRSTFNKSNTKLKNIVSSKQKRFQEMKKLTPGPGQYKLNQEAVSSKYRKIKYSKFLSSPRKTYFDYRADQSKKVPGPQYIIL